MEIVHSLANRFPALPQKEPGYAILYSQPRLAKGEPKQRLVWEQKKEPIDASDDVEATRLMCEFLGQGLLELGTETHARVCIRLIATHPYRVVRDYNHTRKVG